MPPGFSAVSSWLDRFFASYYVRRPVNATFVGVHDFDARLADYSENGAGDTLAEMQSLLEQSRKLPEKPRTAFERIDLELARGFLEIESWEMRSRHFHRGNPSLYTGEAVFSLIALFLTEFAPLSERVDAAIARMEAIPAFLEQGRRNVSEAPAEWTGRAIRECEGALAFLTGGVEALAAEKGIEPPAFRTAARRAAEAFSVYRDWLESDLLRHASNGCSCGDEALALCLRRGHFLDIDADEMVRYAEARLTEASRRLDERARDSGVIDPGELLGRLAGIHPPAERYYFRYQELWDEARRHAEAADLVTWPEFPIRYVARPAWARKAAPYLYFLFYRSPAAFHRPPAHDYLVTPVEPSIPSDEQERLLRATNDGVIKLNHVIHHGGLGHHVQNWHAFRSSSRIGQVAAVDCASRIAMFCGGTMAEGWACYATDLMDETGFLSPLERCAELQSRARMCARAIVDVRLHQGRITLEEAARFYRENAGMTEEGARSEAVKNSMFPGAAVMYLAGSDAIHRLRREMAALWGSGFSLRRFHDEFLSYGSIPVSVIADEMKGGAG